MFYVAVDIGCIECGEESKVIGIFTDIADAEEELTKHAEYQSEHWHGEHSFELFEVSDINKALKVPE